MQSGGMVGIGRAPEIQEAKANESHEDRQQPIDHQDLAAVTQHVTESDGRGGILTGTVVPGVLVRRRRGSARRPGSDVSWRAARPYSTASPDTSQHRSQCRA